MEAVNLFGAETVSLFIRLLIAHLAGDFVFQKTSWVESRQSLKWRSPFLYLNAGIVTMLSWALSGYHQVWAVPLFIFAAHAFTDLLKSYAPDTTAIFYTDQALHLGATIVATALYLPALNAGYSCCGFLFRNYQLWIYIGAYLTVLWPMGIFIAQFTKQWQAESNQSGGLKDAGRYIGMLERLLILTFIFANQFAAIGFLIAAKSVLRFGDIRESGNRKGAEYILIGTMISFAAAIFTGIAANYLINLPDV
ncbi:hypothetical protein SDC9_15473 [bioreactor metagenome]|jgi:hypothetical protein|uniref:DUF3307 domain-containing protein n=1 Tax=bioreactor metagenome TaxID=1076179 RepID=A0A644TS78_9ZZZZ|nr:DUF3307 domain-containing protein [Lentimicrobium sp.]MEA5110545.1 DUF3307 domain-containing protein [Lentimicrobium sp.]HCT72223.1 DUF3307 domain-containing protein [Bacteroidales bacterium]